MAARSQIAGTLPSQETGQGVCWGAIPSLEPCHGIPDGVHCVSWSLASQRLRSGSDRCVRRNRRTAALDYISSASCTPSRRTTSAVTAGGVAADTRGAAGLAGAEGRVDSCHVGPPSFNPTRERWTIGIRSGWPFGLPGGSRQTKPPPSAFSRGVCLAVPPARVCPTAAVAGLEKVLWTVGEGAMRALPTACIPDPSGASVEQRLADPRPTRPSAIRRQGDSRCCAGWSGLVGRQSGLDGAGVRTKEDTTVHRLQIRHSGERPGLHPPPQSEEPKTFWPLFSHAACVAATVALCNSSLCE